MIVKTTHKAEISRMFATAQSLLYVGSYNVQHA
jgi:hypothetical protein